MSYGTLCYGWEGPGGILHYSKHQDHSLKDSNVPVLLRSFFTSLLRFAKSEERRTGQSYFLI